MELIYEWELNFNCSNKLKLNKFISQLTEEQLNVVVSRAWFKSFITGTDVLTIKGMHMYTLDYVTAIMEQIDRRS